MDALLEVVMIDGCCRELSDDELDKFVERFPIRAAERNNDGDGKQRAPKREQLSYLPCAARHRRRKLLRELSESKVEQAPS